MAKATKVATVTELAEHFRTSSAAVLTEYRGLSVAQLKELRRTLGPTVTYAVVKNTLTKIAAKDAGVTGLDDLLAGPSAIAFVTGDAVYAAKVIRNFAKDNVALVIKGGIMDGKVLDAADIQKIADLESREVLLSKLAGAMKAKQSHAVALFAAPLAKAARALGALQAKLEADPSAQAAPQTPVAEAPVAEAPAADEAVEAVAEEVVTPETQATEAAVEETTEG
ncbi:MAG: 50S ribosomal protein L10 [Actinomycetota bacterium]|nr:50S ribosomal protein L10 [Actinomycetota bacterium]